jgi:hypothetical protein
VHKKRIFIFLWTSQFVKIAEVVNIVKIVQKILIVEPTKNIKQKNWKKTWLKNVEILWKKLLEKFRLDHFTRYSNYFCCKMGPPRVVKLVTVLMDIKSRSKDCLQQSKNLYWGLHKKRILGVLCKFEKLLHILIVVMVIWLLSQQLVLSVICTFFQFCTLVVVGGVIKEVLSEIRNFKLV